MSSVLVLGAISGARRGGSCQAWGVREEGKNVPNLVRKQSSSARKLANPGRDPTSDCRFLECVRFGASLWKPRRTPPWTSAVGDVIVLCGNAARKCLVAIPYALPSRFHAFLRQEITIRRWSRTEFSLPSRNPSPFAAGYCTQQQRVTQDAPGFGLDISGCIYATRHSLIPETPHVRGRRRQRVFIEEPCPSSFRQWTMVASW